MGIGKTAKDVVEFNDKLLDRIHTAFGAALNEIEENEVLVKDGSKFGENLKATIGGYGIDIPLQVVLNELRQSGRKGIPVDILDVKIKNVVHELIIKELTL